MGQASANREEEEEEIETTSTRKKKLDLEKKKKKKKKKRKNKRKRKKSDDDEQFSKLSYDVIVHSLLPFHMLRLENEETVETDTKSKKSKTKKKEEFMLFGCFSKNKGRRIEFIFSSLSIGCINDDIPVINYSKLRYLGIELKKFKGESLKQTPILESIVRMVGSGKMSNLEELELNVKVFYKDHKPQILNPLFTKDNKTPSLKRFSISFSGADTHITKFRFCTTSWSESTVWSKLRSFRISTGRGQSMGQPSLLSVEEDLHFIQSLKQLKKLQISLSSRFLEKMDRDDDYAIKLKLLFLEVLELSSPNFETFSQNIWSRFDVETGGNLKILKINEIDSRLIEKLIHHNVGLEIIEIEYSIFRKIDSRLENLVCDDNIDFLFFPGKSRLSCGDVDKVEHQGMKVLPNHKNLRVFHVNAGQRPFEKKPEYKGADISPPCFSERVEVIRIIFFQSYFHAKILGFDYKHLHTLQLEQVGENMEVLNVMKLPFSVRLKSLHLTSPNTKDNFFIINSFPNLEELTVKSSPNVTGKGWNPFSNHQLRELSFSGCDLVTDDFFKENGDYISPKLENLLVRHCPKVSGVNWGKLEFTNLLVFEVFKCVNFEDSCFQENSFPSLTQFNLSFDTKIEVVKWKKMKSLKTVVISASNKFQFEKYKTSFEKGMGNTDVVIRKK